MNMRSAGDFTFAGNFDVHSAAVIADRMLFSGSRLGCLRGLVC
jgi:hypothetical protein